MVIINGRVFATLQMYIATVPVELMESQGVWDVVDDGENIPPADDPFWSQEGLESYKF